MELQLVIKIFCHFRGNQDLHSPSAISQRTCAELLSLNETDRQIRDFRHLFSRGRIIAIPLCV